MSEERSPTTSESEENAILERMYHGNTVDALEIRVEILYRDIMHD
jgi:hypothetical protein